MWPPFGSENYSVSFGRPHVIFIDEFGEELSRANTPSEEYYNEYIVRGLFNCRNTLFS